ncbi:glucosamine-6-phosphate deaminase [Niabella hibiscisoli]|uniref:glucosamine-6-phosphate deaminase n=1 Tax=Niabella hibiscisoli TaxID=1825928 RepID=UPI001F0EC871|nr:glucosamine-6-phosphate deaminase [Niabella hibiscisoli]MCH5719538.1 glucosamine-6-phosphate deaminase [Niabella hibiscisoli]
MRQIQVFDNKMEGSRAIARYIANLVKRRQEENKPVVLGLATGSTPIGVYEELVRIHKTEGLSFKHVVTFNLDEYYPMRPSSHQSYAWFMHHHLFSHIDISAQNIHIPDGALARNHIPAFCRGYEAQIKNAGGIDLQLLGIGRTGHIGFNEPPVSADTITRLVSLHNITIEDAAADFGSISFTPTEAITVGISTIMQAREIIIAGWGQNKAAIIKKAIEANVDEHIPASYLQTRPSVRWVLDKEAAAELSEVPMQSEA